MLCVLFWALKMNPLNEMSFYRVKKVCEPQRGLVSQRGHNLSTPSGCWSQVAPCSDQYWVVKWSSPHGRSDLAIFLRSCCSCSWWKGHTDKSFSFFLFWCVFTLVYFESWMVWLAAWLKILRANGSSFWLKYVWHIFFAKPSGANLSESQALSRIKDQPEQDWAKPCGINKSQGQADDQRGSGGEELRNTLNICHMHRCLYARHDFCLVILQFSNSNAH